MSGETSVLEYTADPAVVHLFIFNHQTKKRHPTPNQYRSMDSLSAFCDSPVFYCSVLHVVPGTINTCTSSSTQYCIGSTRVSVNSVNSMNLPLRAWHPWRGAFPCPSGSWSLRELPWTSCFASFHTPYGSRQPVSTYIFNRGNNREKGPGCHRQIVLQIKVGTLVYHTKPFTRKTVRDSNSPNFRAPFLPTMYQVYHY